MQRVQIYLTNVQYEKVKKLSDETDMSMSEIIRRALDTHIKKEYENGSTTNRQNVETP